MSLTLIVIHLIITLFLVIVILLQNNSGGLGSMAGGAGGGGVFSPRGGKNFLTRCTAILATLFICSSLMLAFVAKNDNAAPSKVDTLLGDLPTPEPNINNSNNLLPVEPIAPIEEGLNPENMEFKKPELPDQPMPQAGDQAIIVDEVGEGLSDAEAKNILEQDAE